MKTGRLCIVLLLTAALAVSLTALTGCASDAEDGNGDQPAGDEQPNNGEHGEHPTAGGEHEHPTGGEHPE